MTPKQVRKLAVSRVLSDGSDIVVGVLAQNRQGVFFQYDNSYLHRHLNLSPFALRAESQLQLAPTAPHEGLHGVFADALPDGWGILLQNRVFRRHGLLPEQITAMDRLAFVGHGAMGALKFDPISELSARPSTEIDIGTMGLQAQALFDGQTDEVLEALVAAGSSGGARPKAQVYFAEGDPSACRTTPDPGDEAWLVKFTSKNLPRGHEEGLCEAAYLMMADKAELVPPVWQLLDAPKRSGARQWLALKRFDWVDNGLQPSGRLHMHSACGLLDADFRTPSLDYEDLIKATSVLCKSPAAGQLQFRRAMFNLFACNQDDHSKNWSFLQDDDGMWQPAPFYDVTFSPYPYGEHATSYGGYGKAPPLKTVQKLALTASFANWRQAQQAIESTVSAIADFADVAKSFGVKRETIRLIVAQLNETWQSNRGLISR